MILQDKRMTYAAIGRALGIFKMTVIYIERRALAKLRKNRIVLEWMRNRSR
jgi:DNA-directed RNA polymerase sigma subunit (sigma70/sigma32)